MPSQQFFQLDCYCMFIVARGGVAFESILEGLCRGIYSYQGSPQQ